VTSVTKRHGVPSHVRIAAYWQGKLIPGTDVRFNIYDIGELCCFACDWYHEACGDCVHGLERAHVVAHAIGGADDDPSNYAILCRKCHSESPNTNDEEWFWRWVATYPENRDPLSQFYRKLGKVNVCIPDSAKDAVAAVNRLSPEELRPLLIEAVMRIRPTRHFGVGSWSASTLARIVCEVAAIHQSTL
jgi:hypothetical protein